MSATNVFMWPYLPGIPKGSRVCRSEVSVRCRSSAIPQAVAEKDMSKADCSPLLDALHACAGSRDAPFYFPGHKKGSGAPTELQSAFGRAVFEHDLPELPELDNLFSPEGVILEAQKQAASTFGADQTFFLVNGSTVGIQSAIMATCSPEAALVLPRNAHQCATSALILSGAVPHYFVPPYDSHWDLALAADPATIEKVLDSALSVGRVGAVLIVSPTYHGVCSDIRRVASMCHDRNVALIVDEAHGGHFRFHESFPLPALQQGADVVIQSTHKVLASLTQSAMLHMRGERVSSSMVARCLQLLQSSSPSYLLLASLDAATHQMRGLGGRSALGKALDLAYDTRAALSNLPGIEVFGCDEASLVPPTSARFDPLRITVRCSGLGLSGYQVDDILRLEFGVVAELPSLTSLTFALSMGTLPEHTEALLFAFLSISDRYGHHDKYDEHEEKARVECARHSDYSCIARDSGLFTVHSDIISSAESKVQGTGEAPSYPLLLPSRHRGLTPREAFWAPSEWVPASKAAGRLSAALLCPYPPGIPALVPGEEISHEVIQRLQAIVKLGGSVSGAEDPSLERLQVIVDSG